MSTKFKTPITTILKPKQKVIFEFETSGDWKPLTPLCWTECPFVVCTHLGDSCLAYTNKLCPFIKNLHAEAKE